MKSPNWLTVPSVLFLSGVLVGGWLVKALFLSLAAITRNGLVPFRSTEGFFVLTTIAVLAGVAILSIRIGTVVEYVFKK